MCNPAHPGELIRETIEGIEDETGQKLSLAELAQGLETTRASLSRLLNCKQSVTPEMALKLAANFPTTSAEFWLRVQENYDLSQAQ